MVAANEESTPFAAGVETGKQLMLICYCLGWIYLGFLKKSLLTKFKLSAFFYVMECLNRI